MGGEITIMKREIDPQNAHRRGTKVAKTVRKRKNKKEKESRNKKISNMRTEEGPKVVEKVVKTVSK